MRFCGIMLGALLAAAAQIRARVAVGAPRSPDGDRSDAFTRWKYSRWQPGSAAGGCRASEASVTLQIDLSFPLWTRPRAASPAVADVCAGSMRALACHEQGHADDVRAHDPAVVRAIRGSACGTANAAGDRQFDLRQARRRLRRRNAPRRDAGRALPLRPSRC
jgi:predicted secreted Zn-dependent protease